MYPQGTGKNKTALVTGAAQGIGLAFAENLAKQGYDLVVVDYQKDKIYLTAESLKTRFPISVSGLHLDLSLPDAAESLYHYCTENHIEIHILVSNAGRFVFQSITEMDDETYRTILYLHVITPAKLCKYFGSEMKKRREGYLLVISSLSAWMPYPYISLYASTKRFLQTFSRAIHFEFSPYNVGVTTVCPGAVDTDLVAMKAGIRRFARRSGLMISPDLLAQRALKKMYHKRITYIPGILNKVFLPLITLCPVRILSFFYKCFS